MPAPPFITSYVAMLIPKFRALLHDVVCREAEDPGVRLFVSVLQCPAKIMVPPA